ncbi:glycosyl hydrolase [Flavilitoribacter nigricans]|uniref:DNA-binding protein n=1 Tax=Flavilitoribacter nigricans (strain ATCC 23147 / DSM 23189 / NBRC 102662 / NCIMB 1420 / SS-2) TaxID=1122177 RepID=A0A2D0N1S6_FLAN2|nr:glycosyl hydrolase [Flavilitoribacter nigricans]PHN02417.1 DNA-binding protein [Flavilitoribacter nigricans DSM 23189 = NBRC 102662]
MRPIRLYLLIQLALLSLLFGACGSVNDPGTITESDAFTAQPWVFWYWNDAAVSKAGITLDLEAMQQQGIGGAYIFFIRGASDPPKFTPPAVQMTEHWWDLVRFAFAEAERVGIKLGLHACDGFTTAGGPWISPEKSMKKVVWADALLTAGEWSGDLPQPETIEGFYQDIKTYAYRVDPEQLQSSYLLKPLVTTNLPDTDVFWLNDPAIKDQRLRADEPGWIQFEFDKPFTCRSITIKAAGNIFQAHRLIVETSNNGTNFQQHTRLQPQRQGWMDGQVDVTHAIPPATARYFRLRYDPEGTEPGAEDLDAAKWRQSLKIPGIELSAEAKIHQYEGKNGSIWRIADHTAHKQFDPEQWISPEDIIDLTDRVDANGKLQWTIPAGNWRVRRIGYTSTGKTNYIGGGAKGLECDKFDPAAVELQFDSWLGAFYEQIPPETIEETLKIFHVDSWECGSQNWSASFTEEFASRRGYDLLPYLLVMTGVPVQSAEFSEKVLLDVRETIGELVRDNFFGTFKQKAAAKGLLFSAESIAPVMVGDGMLHHGTVDLPMGEFWYNSPTHDKPNDILDAISGGHIYGKKIIQSESFTEIRLDWDEHPAKLKQDLDRNFALGINRIIFHVFNHNPWVDKKPGMTLGTVGFFYQPNQTWFATGGPAWMDYITRCQELLQTGVPVVDVAVFTGEEFPRRALLPDRLVPVLPGIFGDTILRREKARLANSGIPTRQRPAGVTSVANIADPVNWVDPLRGNAYDSFNRHALLRLSEVRDGKIVLPGGAAYSLLVIPGSRRMMPEGNRMSLAVAKKILQLVREGANVYMQEKPTHLLELEPASKQAEFDEVIHTLFAGSRGTELVATKIGKGQLITGTYTADSFEPFGLAKDVVIGKADDPSAQNIAWNHRRHGDEEVYFIANQSDKVQDLDLSFRVSGKTPMLYDPNRDQWQSCSQWQTAGERTTLPLRLNAFESRFVVFGRQQETDRTFENNWPEYTPVQELNGAWSVSFDTAFGGPAAALEFKQLIDWTAHESSAVRYYSGTVVYSNNFEWKGEEANDSRYYLSLGEVHDLAQIKINGEVCGVAWTAPYEVDITDFLRAGNNLLEVEVSNTWANRLIGDHALPEAERVTWTTAPYRLEGRELLPAGLLGPITIFSVE